MLRNFFTSRTGRAIGAASIGLASLSLTVAATSTIAGAAIATPSITSLSPTSVHTVGGTAVTIKGKSLTDKGYTTTVKVGTLVIKPSKSATTSVTFTSPAELSSVNSEPVSVSVAKKGQKTLTSKAKTLTYTVGAPAAYPAADARGDRGHLRSETPAAGPTSGGTTVTITGLYFASNAAVAFGSTEGVSTHFVSSTELTSVSPAEGVGRSTSPSRTRAPRMRSRRWTLTTPSSTRGPRIFPRRR